MPDPLIIESLKLDSYAGLLQSLLPEEISLAVYCGDGWPVWDDGNFPKLRGRDLSHWINAQGDEELSVRSRSVDGIGSVYTASITDQQQQPVATLAIVLTSSEKLANRLPTSLAEAISSVAACVSREYQLNAEAGMLADELAERYEELNLVYEAEDGTGTNATGPEAMQELVNSCIDFLNVGMVVLALPEKKIGIFSVNQDHPIENRQRILLTIRDSLFDWIRENRQPLVINRTANPLRVELCPDIPHKLVAVPVEAGGSQPVGILVIINHHERVDFTNSDRNLLNVIARKLAKMIMASFDTVTGLENLSSFEKRLESALASAQTKGLSHSILNIDIDQMQIINGICGRQAGDDLLLRTGKLIQQQIRSQDVVARIGGDEFGVLLENCPLEVASSIATNIQRKTGDMLFEWNGEEHEISVCIGLAPVSVNADSYAGILSAVEVARNAAKERGRNKLRTFETEDLELLRRKGEMQWVSRIQKALREDQFELQGQPIVALHGERQEYHYEVLIRMRGEAGELLSPGAFMPAAEHFYLMPAIDRWVISKTFNLLTESWPIFDDQRVTLSINLSGQSIGEDGFLTFLIDHLRNSPLPSETFCFEITETAAIANLEEAKELIRVVKEMGCSVSLDDFGSGLSSYTYLKNLAVDALKIDGSFIRDIVVDNVSRSMVSAINQIGHTMGLHTIAEWVENDAVVEILRELGVDSGQGYGLGRPMPLEEQLNALRCMDRVRANQRG